MFSDQSTASARNLTSPYCSKRYSISQDLKTGHCRTGSVSMKGLSLQVSENSEGVRFLRRGIAFLAGMFELYGTRDVWVQRNGLNKTSENTLSH